jgi:hypothetical protein
MHVIPNTAWQEPSMASATFPLQMIFGSSAQDQIKANDEKAHVNEEIL